MSSRRGKQPTHDAAFNGKGEEGGPAEAAAFVWEGVHDLMQVCQRHKLDTLCYLLDMARMEAEAIVRTHRRQSGH